MYEDIDLKAKGGISTIGYCHHAIVVAKIPSKCMRDIVRIANLGHVSGLLKVHTLKSGLSLQGDPCGYMVMVGSILQLCK
jgi:hypothetical protein